MSFLRVGVLLVVLAAVVAPGCAPVDQGSDASGPKEVDAMNPVAEEYVKLVLSLGRHDADYVDAYYGPETWQTEAEAGISSPTQLHLQAADLKEQMRRIVKPTAEMEGLRHTYLTTQLAADEARLSMLLGEHFTFDEESRALAFIVSDTP